MTTAAGAVAEPLAQRHRPLHTARLAFRTWRRGRPFWAGVWAMLGGALIAYVPATAFKLFLVANASLVIGVLVGALVGFFGLMLWFARPLRVVLGVLILLLSLVSFLTSDFGGLLLGMMMGLVGGSLGLAWVPSKVTWRQRRRARKLAAAGVPVSGMVVAAGATTPIESGEPASVAATAAATAERDEAVARGERELTDVILGPEETDTLTAPVDGESPRRPSPRHSTPTGSST